MEDINLWSIKSEQGSRMVPLKAVANWHPMLGPQSVNHINQFTSATLFFNLKPGYSIGQATDFVEKAAKQVLPAGIRGEVRGGGVSVPHTGSWLPHLLVLAVLVMFVIFSLIFESLFHSITVFC